MNKVIKSLILKRSTIAFLHDACIAGLSLPLALFLRVGDSVLNPIYLNSFVYTIPLFVLSSAVIFRVFGLYKGLWRYASKKDLIAITKSVTCAILVFLPLAFLFNRLDDIPRSLPIIHWMLLIVMLGGPRFAYRVLKDKASFKNSNSKIPVLLVGAGPEADLFIRKMETSNNSCYKIVGVLDDRRGRVGQKIHNIEILGTIKHLQQAVEKLKKVKLNPSHVVITQELNHVKARHYDRLLKECNELGIALSRLPDLTQFKMGLSDKIEVRPVNLSDLLGRPQTSLDRRSMKELIEGRKILITGAGGTIGSELTRQICSFKPAKLCLLDNSEFNLYSISQAVQEKHGHLKVSTELCDIRNRDRLENIFKQEKPELVFHAAALKHVSMVEKEVEEAFMINVVGTKNVADLSVKYKVETMVFISTDKAANPTSVLGATKKLAESYCQSLDNIPTLEGTKFSIVRFGNVLGSSGSVVPFFEKQIAQGGPVTISHPDAKRFFMTTYEAVELVLQASALRHCTIREYQGKIFVLDMGEPILIQDLAKQLIRLSGLIPDQDIELEYTSLKPGEKIEEELFSESEVSQKTLCNGVLLAVSNVSDKKFLEKSILELSECAEKQQPEKVIDRLKQIIPEYKVRHIQYKQRNKKEGTNA